MKIKIILGLSALMGACCGCTSFALHHSTLNESKSLSDLLADQILYNLALAKDFHDGVRVNGLPSFVTLSSGMSSVQQNINGTLTVAITTGPSTETPAATAGHQTTDNWAFTPVVDPSQLTRLVNLYKSEFQAVDTNQIATIFPVPPPALDPQGRPILDYTPMTTNGSVIFDLAGNPKFTAKPKLANSPHNSCEIPGAFVLFPAPADAPPNLLISISGTNYLSIQTNCWFSFSRPADMSPAQSFGCRMGPYLDHYVWITNADNFLKFSILALGTTNTYASVPASSGSGSSGVIQNGLIRFY